MIISINDHPDIRAVFSGLKIREVKLNYTVGGSKKGAKKNTELIVSNFV